jgi:hypothetical protein
MAAAAPAAKDQKAPADANPLSSTAGVVPPAGAAHLKDLRDTKLDEKSFVGLLGKLMGEVEHHLMNRPPKHVPQESMAGRHVLDALKPYSGPKYASFLALPSHSPACIR